MNTWSLGSSGTPYLDADIDWLEEKLEGYRNQRVFIFTHLFFPTRAGNLNDIYPNGNWLGGSQLTRIQALNDRYKNSIWFSGHSHWKCYLQQYQDRANIYKNDCGWNIHIPSCASPIDSDGTTRVSMPLESEGAIIDVYSNCIIVRGMDLKNTKYLPIGQYLLDTTLITIPSKDDIIEPPVEPPTEGEDDVIPEGYTKLTANNFIALSSFTGTIEQDGEDIVISYPTGLSETSRIAVRIDGFTSDANLYIGSYSTSLGESEKSFETGIGFYGSDKKYYLTTTDMSIAYSTTLSYNGYQFNLSNSEYIGIEGPLPLTVRLRNVAMKYK